MASSAHHRGYRNHLKQIGVACGMLALCTSISPSSWGQTNEELSAKIALLEAQLLAIKEQLNRQQDDLIRVDEKLGNTPNSPTSARDGIRIGDTTLNLTGFVDLDVHMTKFSDGELPSGSLGRDLYISQLTPVREVEPRENGFDTDFTAKSSRFGFTTVTPIEGHDLSTFLEVDFLLSPGGNEAISNSFNPRLRRAYVDYQGWRIGQDWTTFQTMQAMPESVSFFAPAESQVFVRQPVVRYTNGNFQFALENPNTNVFGLGLVDDGLIPDAVMKYQLSGETYRIDVSALARQLRYESETVDGSALGWGLSLAGRVYLGEDDIRFSLQGGEGMGRYVGLGISPGAVIDASGEDIEAIPSYSGNIAYRKVFGDRSLSGGYSYIAIDNDIALTGTGATSQSQSWYIALTQKLGEDFTVGAEYLQGIREIESGLEGKVDRVTFSVRKGF